MDNKIPPIEVFIPVFNDVDNIERAVLSCLNQENVSLRVIVSDNQSTDGTFEKLEKLVSHHSNLIIHRNSENIGMTPNIVKYVDLVQAPYFMFLCSDDYLCDNSALSQAFEMLEGSEEIQSVYCNISFVNRYGTEFAKNIFKREAVFDADVALKESIISLRNKFGIALLHRTKIARQHPHPPNANYVGDFWQSYEIGKHGRCGHINKVMIANSYTGENATGHLMFEALQQTKALQKEAGITLTKTENMIQKFNYYWVTFQKAMALKVVLPLWNSSQKKG